ncbi:hypothetical protein J2S05_002163 [Alkalicoccobacillus murimartini]|uniref:Uncharacterized protein n=2 Tax=Alkalicoccobacillus murimartini TaxID=171685 RepID=A0ABT9YHM9_9BACI|nr:hypothetical protein [Alkalicoccobacillus murimartini]
MIYVLITYVMRWESAINPQLELKLPVDEQISEAALNDMVEQMNAERVFTGEATYQDYTHSIVFNNEKQARSHMSFWEHDSYIASDAIIWSGGIRRLPFYRSERLDIQLDIPADITKQYEENEFLLVLDSTHVTGANAESTTKNRYTWRSEEDSFLIKYRVTTYEIGAFSVFLSTIILMIATPILYVRIKWEKQRP